MMSHQSIYQALSELEKNNESAALCTVMKSEGSTPRHVGSKMLVYPDGKFIGTVGGGELENRVIKAALESHEDGKAQTLSYTMADPITRRPGRVRRNGGGVCGTDPSPCMIVVIGAGHVGKAVVHLAKWLGFRVAVSDDRAEFCNPEVRARGGCVLSRADG